MRVIILALIAIAVITIGSKALLGQAGYSTAEQTAGQAVRLD